MVWRLERFLRYLPIGGFIGLIFLIEVLFLVNNSLLPTNVSITENYLNNILIESFNYFSYDYINYLNILNLTNIEQIGAILYTKYVYLFIIASLILLVAMIGAIILTLNQKLKNRYQDIYTQTNREINESIRYLK